MLSFLILFVVIMAIYIVAYILAPKHECEDPCYKCLDGVPEVR